jgi:hypothetical protein
LAASRAVPPLFTFIHSALTTERLLAVKAELNSMNIGGTTFLAVAYTATIAASKNIINNNTARAPDVVGTTTVALCFRNTCGTIIRLTSITSFEITACHTPPNITTSAAPLPTTIRAVAPFALFAHRTDIIHAIILTIMTVVCNAIIACVSL